MVPTGRLLLRMAGLLDRPPRRRELGMAVMRHFHLKWTPPLRRHHHLVARHRRLRRLVNRPRVANSQVLVLRVAQLGALHRRQRRRWGRRRITSYLMTSFCLD